MEANSDYPTGYFRVSTPGKETFTIEGKASTQQMLTHISIGDNSHRGCSKYYRADCRPVMMRPSNPQRESLIKSISTSFGEAALVLDRHDV
jgi:hypothetical protein